VRVLYLGESFIPSEEVSFADVEYANQRRVSLPEEFLTAIDATIPWSRWVGLIEPFTYSGRRGRKPKAPEATLRVYPLQRGSRCRTRA
jgi:hypothetical protein